MTVEPYVVKMTPYLRKKIWGGRRLETQFGKELPDDGHYGEAWEVSDLDEGQSAVVNGPLEGSGLDELVDLWGDKLTGGTDAFPLLVKILDAQRDLSVQVHPGEDDLADSDLEGASKDECWLILDADPEGAILHGFEEGIERQAFREAVRQQRVEEILRRVNVRAGDLIRVEPGTIHAICEGVVLLEIQQPSDTTYRVYDYGRLGDDGKPRELHLDEAMQVADFGPHRKAKVNPGKIVEFGEGCRGQSLLKTPHYSLEKLDINASLSLRMNRESPNVIFVRSGALNFPESGFELGAGETAVVPADVETVAVDNVSTTEIIVAGANRGRQVMAVE